MLLAVDIGNSSITVGGFREEEEPFFSIRFGSGEQRTADEYAAALRAAAPVQLGIGVIAGRRVKTVIADPIVDDAYTGRKISRAGATVGVEKEKRIIDTR